MTSTDEDEVYRRLALLDARLRAIHKGRGVAAAHAPEIAAIKAALADLGGSAGTDLKHQRPAMAAEDGISRPVIRARFIFNVPA